MTKNIYKKEKMNASESYKYFSSPFWDIYYSKQKCVIKNYVIDPDIKVIKD